MQPDCSCPFEVRTAQKMRDFIEERMESLNAAAYVGTGGATLFESSSAENSEDKEASSDQQIDPVTLLNAAPGAFVSGLKEPLSASLWPYKVVQALARESTLATFVETCRVLKIVEGASADETDAGHTTVHTSKGELIARTVIVATNAWITDVLPELEAHVKAVTNTVLCSKLPVPPEMRWPIATISCGDGAEEVYINQREDGRIVLGGLRSKDQSLCQSDSGPGDSAIAHALQEWFRERFPAMASVIGSYEYCWKGCIGIPQDGMPIAGRLPGRGDMVYVCGGFAGHGMPRCLGLAEGLVQHICGLEVSEAEYMARCDVRRFFTDAILHTP
ncbi:hypothetical protein CYMTET_31910 [Cymbomonas tetramitiformis]|uniref:FAD dependent oxidoreductase domain-containing protein n=1 Tax=Cymbomonas tetramitiformis TaxID=36881 RepID=A0AAE0FG62_9CHLO|nr:hypothetical protein CYMTET_31910 [Cymbomonas tetramitiformis]